MFKTRWELASEEPGEPFLTELLDMGFRPFAVSGGQIYLVRRVSWIRYFWIKVRLWASQNRT